MQKLGDIVSERASAAFAGRARELEVLLQLLEKDGPLALHVHGVAGIGKSSLLEVFAGAGSVREGRACHQDRLPDGRANRAWFHQRDLGRTWRAVAPASTRSSSGWPCSTRWS